jgi:DNA-binding MarR family transcriptional regulator
MRIKIMPAKKKELINPLEPYLGYHLRRISAASMASLALSLAELGIRPSESTVILFVEVTPGVRQSLIGKHLGIRRANMAPLIAGLEAKGLCRKEALDGRSSGIKLTRAGINCAVKIKQKIQENEERSFGQLNAKEFKSLLNLVSSIDLDLISTDYSHKK